MNLPKKIKFGHRTITVEYTDKLWYDQQITADVCADSHHITIDTTMGNGVQRRSLFLNIMYTAFAVNFICEDETDNLETLVLGLFATCRDNPKLFVPSECREVAELRIMGNQFSVSAENDNDYEGKAFINYHHERIKYKPCAPTERVHQSLIHEVIHAIFRMLSLKNPGHADVHRMAWLISMLFHQNDFSWLLEDGDES